MSTCDRHEEVVTQVKDHEVRIHNLEISDATMGENLKNLTKQLENLVGWIKALVISMLATGGGFIIWYIQSL